MQIFDRYEHVTRLVLVGMLTILLSTVLGVGHLGASVQSPPAQPSQVAQEDLPVAVLLTAIRAVQGASRMHAWFEIPGEALPRSTPMILSVEAQAVDSQGAVKADFQRAISLPADEASQARESSLKIHGDLLLTPGTYDLRLRIVEGVDRVLTERALPFEVQAYKSDQAAVMPPFFIDDEGDAIVVRGPQPENIEDATVDAAADSADPFVTGGGESFVPNVVPVLEEGPSRARVTLIGYHLTQEKSLLDASLFNAEGSLLGKDRLGLIGQSDTAPDGLDRLDFSLQTEGLATGEYQLEVSIQDLEHGRTNQTLMPFRIK